MMALRTKVPLFLCILMASTTISLSIGKPGGSITDNEEAGDGKLFNTSTTILAGSSLSFESGTISGNMSIVIIAPCSSDNYQLPHLSPNSIDHNNIEFDAFANSAHPLHEMACWRSSLNIITLHLQVDSGITNSIAEEHFSTGEKVLCGAFLCWNTDHQSIDCNTSTSKNAQARNIFPFSAVATGRQGSATALRCGLNAKANLSLYCWGNQFESGSFLSPVLQLNGYGFQIVHPGAAVETRKYEKRSSESRQLMDVETPPARRAHISSHDIDVDIPAAFHGTPSCPAVAPANPTIPFFNPTAVAPSSTVPSKRAPSSPAGFPAPTAPRNTTPSSPASLAPSPTVNTTGNTPPAVPFPPSSPASLAPSPTINTTGNTPPAVPFAPSTPTVAPAPAPAPTSSEASAPAPSFPAVTPAPAISSSTAPAAPTSHESSVTQVIKEVIVSIALLMVAGLIGLGTYAVLHFFPGPGDIDPRDTQRVRPIDEEQTAP